MRATRRLIGWANSMAMLANLAATASAALLIHLGGYPLVGWASVAFAVVQGLLASTLPVSARARHAPRDDSALAETEEAASQYVRMLRAGLAESRHHPDVRRVLLLAAAMVGLTAYDEYFPLVARAHHVDTGDVPLLVAITVAGQAVGTALTGWSARLGGRAVGAILAAGAAARLRRRPGHAVRRVRRDRGRLRHAQQLDAGGGDPPAGHDHRARAGDRDQRARPPRGGRRPARVRRVRAGLRTASASRSWSPCSGSRCCWWPSP